MPDKDNNNREINLKSLTVSKIILTTKLLFNFITILVTLWCNSVKADNLHLVFNGISHHSNPDVSKKYNERNMGIGIQYDFSDLNKTLIPSVYFGGLNDSFENPSYYIGTGLAHRTRFNSRKQGFNIDVGMLLLVMSREYTLNSRNNGISLVPAALPMLSVGTNATSLNITYIPKIDEMNASVWFMQLKIKLDSF